MTAVCMVCFCFCSHNRDCNIRQYFANIRFSLILFPDDGDSGDAVGEVVNAIPLGEGGQSELTSWRLRCSPRVVAVAPLQHLQRWCAELLGSGSSTRAAAAHSQATTSAKCWQPCLGAGQPQSRLKMASGQLFLSRAGTEVSGTVQLKRCCSKATKS
jgi:hypothetical protein